MPLQVRRGTETQRTAMVEPLASGELLYVTNTGTLYIGDGDTLGGTAVANLTESGIKNITGTMFTEGTHSGGISFAYDGTYINATVDIVLSNYAGTIRADAFEGSVFPDDSSLGGEPLVDAIRASINLNGTVKGNIIPDSDSAYDIGSSGLKFRDLYLSGTSLHLGDATITSSGGVVELPAGSTIGGVVIGTGTGTGTGDGVIEGSTYKINIAADDSSLMINSDTEIITASGGFIGDVTGNLQGNVTGNLQGDVTGNLQGNVTGNLQGDVTGNGNFTSIYADLNNPLTIFTRTTLGGNVTALTVTPDVGITMYADLAVPGGTVRANQFIGSMIGDDSTVIIDAATQVITVGGSVNAPDGNFDAIETESITTNRAYLDIVNANPIRTTTVRRYVPESGNHTESYAISNGSTGTGENNFVSRGTLSAPAILQLGDIIYGTNVVGHNGTTYQLTTAINHFVDPGGTINGTTVPGTISLSTFTDGNPANFKGVVIDSRGFVGINKGVSPAEATLDVNGFAKLAILTAAPASPVNGIIAIADGTTWNPMSNGKQTMVVYLGGTWREIAAAA